VTTWSLIGVIYNSVCERILAAFPLGKMAWIDALATYNFKYNTCSIDGMLQQRESSINITRLKVKGSFNSTNGIELGKTFGNVDIGLQRSNMALIWSNSG
jgi:hypothetical protein